jgi:AAA domain
MRVEGNGTPRPATGDSLDRAERGTLATAIEIGSGELPRNIARVISHAPESFFDLKHGTVAQAFKLMRERGEPIDFESVAIKSGQALFISQELIRDMLPVEVADEHAATVWAAYQVRKAQSVFDDAANQLRGSPAQARLIVDGAIATLTELTARASNGLPEIVDAAEFLGAAIPMPAELVAGILHHGSKCAIGGNSKAFKTWILLDLAVAVATGSDWLGFRTTKGKVLYVNFEIQPAPWQRRIAAVTRAKGVELKPGDIALWTLRGHAADFRDLIPKIIARARMEGFALIVLDPLYKLLGTADENSARDIAEMLNVIERLAVETKAAVAYANHFAKGNASGKEAQDRISGSGVFARDPDTLAVFTAHETEGSFTVETILRNFPPVPPFVVSWQFPLMARDEALDPADLKQVAGRKREHDPVRLLAKIANNDAANPISASEWARLAEIPRKTLTDYLAEMRQRGWIKTIGEGSRAKQAITNEGKAILNS